MNRSSEISSGLVGAAPKDPVLVRVSMGIKGVSGSPVCKGRFWMTSVTTRAEEFQRKSGGAWYGLVRDLAPGFEAWNKEARALGDDISRKGPGRVGILRGNLVHARLADAARWVRSAHKAPNAGESPKSNRPWCTGNGIEALRYGGMRDGEEIFETIACPNEDCPFAMSKLCRPDVHLIFRLRWREDDPWERQFSPLLAYWHTTSWRSLRSLLGLFELVLGTEAVAPWEPREKWRKGLAADMGVAEPSLVGLPFIMAVGEQTKASQQQRFTVVNFSPDGDLVAWLMAQLQQRQALAAAPAPAALLPASVLDADFRQVQDEARAEWAGPVEPPVQASLPTTEREPGSDDEPPPGDAPALLSPAKVDQLRALAAEAGVDLVPHLIRLIDSGSLETAPAWVEPDLMLEIKRAKAQRRKR